MAERPDLDYAVPILRKALRGARISGVEVHKPVVMRVAVPGEAAALLVGRSFAGVTRRAHFALFNLGELELVVAPMLAGRFWLGPGADKGRRGVAVTFALEDGRELRYRDDVQMGKVYVIARGDHAQVPGLADIGLDVLDPEVFTRAAFGRLAKARRDQVKIFLKDKAALDALGNAYADEVCWRAQIHPKLFVRQLGEAELDRLYEAIPAVLREAAEELARREPPLDEKLRDFLAVRNRHGEPCPRCGTKIRKTHTHGHDAFFCPRCQPDKRGSGLVDWSRIEEKKKQAREGEE